MRDDLGEIEICRYARLEKMTDLTGHILVGIRPSAKLQSRLSRSDGLAQLPPVPDTALWSDHGVATKHYK